MTKKGFTMLETIITLFIISSFFVVSLKRTTNLNLDWIYFSNEYIEIQTNSLIDKESNNILNTYSNAFVSFNSSGKVNHAQTIEIGNKKLIIHLGTGYITYE